MIKAKVMWHGLAFGATWQDGRLLVPEAVADSAAVGHPWHSPAKGGSYLGFDLTDPIEARDFLRWLETQDAVVEVILDNTKAVGLEYPFPNGHDDRDPGLRRTSAVDLGTLTP